MVLTKEAMTDCTTDFFQVLNSMKWEARNLQDAAKELEKIHTGLVFDVNMGKGKATTAQARSAVNDTLKALNDIVARANMHKEMLENLYKLI